MTWRVAASLQTLLDQVNATYPNRSKASDGAIGDPAHAATKSDHNPDPAGVVRARDFTHDPAHGFDAHAFADRLLRSRDPRIKYVISRGRIGSSYDHEDGPAWTWRKYTGTNPHTTHMHVSVIAADAADSTRQWRLTPTQEEDVKLSTPITLTVTTAKGEKTETLPLIGWLTRGAYAYANLGWEGTALDKRDDAQDAAITQLMKGGK